MKGQRMKAVKKWVMGVAVALAAGVAGAQTYMALTNTLYFTNRWTSVVARVQSQPSTTNDPWVIQFTFSGPISPGWARTTNNATVTYGASAYATVSMTNSEIAALTGITVSQVVNMGYFSAGTNAMQAGLNKLYPTTIGF